ncbi:MAG: calcium-binding protein [Solirubrobacteraceae bacterium]
MGNKRGLAVLIVAGFSWLGSPGISHAVVTDPTSCRASATRVTALGAPPLVVSEPVRANPDATPCTTQSASALARTTIGPVVAEAVSAATSRTETAAAAFAAVDTSEITLGTTVIRADAFLSTAKSECVNGKVVLEGMSRVVGLTINGQPIDVPGGPQTIPLGGGGSISFNETARTDELLAQRALVVRIPNVSEIVLAESIAGGDPCPRKQMTPPPATPGQPDVCPPGSVFDPDRVKCIIRDGNGPAPGGTTIVVGPPFKGPGGGTVIGLPEARDRFKSPCLRGKGAQFVVIGTKGKDRVTGTDRRDRFLLFAGRDRAEGGRNGDCIDGGSGKDALSGALGNDRMYGKSGKDLLVGEAGNDLMVGGRGGDNIRSGYGRDQVFGGRDVDTLNAAVNGPASKFIRCGSGSDRARVNRNERNRTVNCERVFVILDRHRPS